MNAAKQCKNNKISMPSDA